jgi:hypothetical protein
MKKMGTRMTRIERMRTDFLKNQHPAFLLSTKSVYIRLIRAIRVPCIPLRCSKKKHHSTNCNARIERMRTDFFEKSASCISTKYKISLYPPDPRHPRSLYSRCAAAKKSITVQTAMRGLNGCARIFLKNQHPAFLQSTKSVYIRLIRAIRVPCISAELQQKKASQYKLQCFSNLFNHLFSGFLLLSSIANSPLSKISL